MSKLRKILPILECDASVKGNLKLDKGAAWRLMRGEPIPWYEVDAEFTYHNDNNEVVTIKDKIISFRIGKIMDVEK